MCAFQPYCPAMGGDPTLAAAEVAAMAARRTLAATGLGDGHGAGGAAGAQPELAVAEPSAAEGRGEGPGVGGAGSAAAEGAPPELAVAGV